MAISIDRSTFPQEGGSFRISITKDDASTWGTVTIATATWYTVGEMTDVSPFLYTIDVDVDENTGSTRTMGIGVTVDGQSELFTITQPAAAAVSANIVNYTTGDVSAAGGQVTVDVQAVNGDDSQSSASSNQSYCTLTSTTHGVTSGGVTCTRFVFTFSQNTGTTPRSATLTFNVTDGGGNTDSITLSKTQKGEEITGGSMSVPSASVAATAGSLNQTITTASMQTATIAVSGSTGWLTSAEVQISGNELVLALVYPANTGASARTQTVSIEGTDTGGNTVTASMTLTQAGTTPPANRISNIYWNSSSPHTPDMTWDYMGGDDKIILGFVGSWNGGTSVSYPATSGLTVTKLNDAQFRVVYDGGSVDQAIYVPFTFEREDASNVMVYAYANLRITPGGVFPIWKDVFGTIVSDEDYEDYELQENGSLLYAGRAFAYPDENDISVNVSRVVAPYLTDYYKDVDFVNEGNTLASYTFVRDYSYDSSMDYTQNLVLNAPVNGRIPSGIKVSASMWGASASGSLQVTDDGGSLVVNEAIVKGLNVGEWISGMVGTKYTFGGITLEVVDMCRGAVLKYVNAYGAVDFLLVEGVAKKTDKITRASYEKDAAAMTKDFETRDYQASMEASWTGTTGWLTDEQSLRMKHLVESVEVYMIDVSSGEEIPVLMRDASLEYKTFDTNGRKMVNYTLSWTESQKKIRR